MRGRFFSRRHILGLFFLLLYLLQFVLLLKLEVIHECQVELRLEVFRVVAKGVELLLSKLM